MLIFFKLFYLSHINWQEFFFKEEFCPDNLVTVKYSLYQKGRESALFFSITYQFSG